MLFKTLFAAAVIGAATAQLSPDEVTDYLEDLDLSPECISVYSELATAIPTVPDDLFSATLPADPCATPSFTGTLQAEWTSFSSAALEFYSAHTAELSSFVSECSGQIGGNLLAGFPICSTTGASTTAAATTPATTPAQTTGSSNAATVTGPTTSQTVTSAGASNSTSPSSTVASPNAAPRETGFVVAAAAAAVGFMGAVAVL
ncbi:hypothetical protein F5Y12DRAFT_89051 [Xylaria sp. FL1777]|nr:hypothetical protein F5Y12DRAFT_89051 [Xylaria sp. FL1777]